MSHINRKLNRKLNNVPSFFEQVVGKTLKGKNNITLNLVSGCRVNEKIVLLLYIMPSFLD